jgi:beta-lactamase class D
MQIKHMNRIISGWLGLAMLMPFTLPAVEVDFSQYFTNKEGCFLLYDLKSHRVIQRFNEKRCALRVAPCSTFKVPLAVMAFDRGILQDENTTFKWDGVDRGRPAVNRDTSAADWLKCSVVWYSQRITPQLGPEMIKSYLAKFDYGNQDISGGLTNFWLGSSLKISADEQLRYLERFWTNGFSVSQRATDLTKKLIYLETGPSGERLSGKTGSHIYGQEELGWFVGHLDGPWGEYLMVVNLTGPTVPTEEYPGLVAKGICEKILGRLELY